MGLETELPSQLRGKVAMSSPVLNHRTSVPTAMNAAPFIGAEYKDKEWKGQQETPVNPAAPCTETSQPNSDQP